MGRPSIEYLNARHGISRGAIRKDRMRDDVSERSRIRDLDALDLAHEQILAMFADFRSFVCNLQPVESIMAGETLDDLAF